MIDFIYHITLLPVVLLLQKSYDVLKSFKVTCQCYLNSFIVGYIFNYRFEVFNVFESPLFIQHYLCVSQFATLDDNFYFLEVKGLFVQNLNVRVICFIISLFFLVCDSISCMLLRFHSCLNRCPFVYLI